MSEELESLPVWQRKRIVALSTARFGFNSSEGHIRACPCLCPCTRPRLFRREIERDESRRLDVVQDLKELATVSSGVEALAEDRLPNGALQPLHRSSPLRRAAGPTAWG